MHPVFNRLRSASLTDWAVVVVCLGALFAMLVVSIPASWLSAVGGPYATRAKMRALLSADQRDKADDVECTRQADGRYCCEYGSVCDGGGKYCDGDKEVSRFVGCCLTF